ncbi:hypothetical protein V495_05219 [Pseudogymnoascus sp. VKM F-4514 (FW-929)]|nr:hypothetical protein V495_05219 [Pseudogymnoascus sp. VKM F-4514 (FW-929)]KFY54868.1 hypothetical protein V497_07391 [Pseudogymnoascus sp. VKM F-4516 (FW-969)]
MKRERESDDEASAPSNDARTGPFSKGYSIFNPGYSFARPPGVQTKPSIKRPRVDDNNPTTHNALVKSEPEPKPERLRELSIQEDEEDLYGLEPGIGPSRHRNSTLPSVQTPSRHMSKLSDTQTPVYNNSHLRGVQTSRHSSHVSDVKTQAVVHHPRENNAPVTVTGNGPSEDELQIVTAIKEKLHKAIAGLTVDEPAPPENPPPWGKHFALSGPCPKLINPALTIYGLGGIGLPLSERDAGLIAKFARPAPDPDTKMNSTVVDLTMSKVTEIAPHQVEMTNPGWEKAVVGVVGKLAKRLKVPGGPANVGLMPHNMTLYGPGDMLKEHRDIPTKPKRGRGVFGTLAICLPSKHEDGDLSVTHGDQVKVLSTDKQSAFGYQYLFWHTELTCELTEVALGHRLVLLYDLIDLNSRDKVDIPVSLEHRTDRLEAALLFWKNSYSELSTTSGKVLVYTLDHIYGEQNLSHAVLEGDDIQRVNVLSELCPKHGFSLYLAILELHVRQEIHTGPTDEFLELHHVVKLDGTTVLDMAPCSASQIVQSNLSDASGTENVSGGVVQVCHRVSVKSSATAMSDWIRKLSSVCISSSDNELARIDLKRANQLVMQDIRHRYNTKGAISDDSEKSPDGVDDLLWEVIRGSIVLHDQLLCGAALSLVRTDILSGVVDAFKCFGFRHLQHSLRSAICSFKHIYHVFGILIEIYNRYEEFKNTKAQVELVAWMKPFAKQTFAMRELKFKEDGEAVARVGIICGGKYLQEILLPAVNSDIQEAEKFYARKSDAVLRFLTIVAEGYNGRHVGLKTARHVVHSVLQVYIARVQIVDMEDGTENQRRGILIKPDQITQLFGQCVSLGLRHAIGLLLDKLDSLSRTMVTSFTFEEFFIPLIKQFDDMFPGGAPGTDVEEFHIKARHITVRRTKDQLAVGVENGKSTKYNAEKRKPPNPKAKTQTPEAKFPAGRTPTHYTSRKI